MKCDGITCVHGVAVVLCIYNVGMAMGGSALSPYISKLFSLRDQKVDENITRGMKYR